MHRKAALFQKLFDIIDKHYCKK